MRVFCFILATCFFVLCVTAVKATPPKEKVYVVVPSKAAPRVAFGAAQLVKNLKTWGYDAVTTADTKNIKGNIIVLHVDASKGPGKEGFLIEAADKKINITGADESGVLYGCLELLEQSKTAKKLPVNLKLQDQPEMVLRGACIGVQKPYYLPGRNVYEYPYTPEVFPWFYDKQLWIQYLDSLVANRMNSLYLWNGHPFASLVRLKDYPYAVEVDEATFKKNEEMYSFLTTEADKRGIWVIQMFYNIIVSKPFAEHHNIKTQERERPITPLIADYTRKSIAAFVEKYPNVGLMVCLGEAMEGVGPVDIE